MNLEINFNLKFIKENLKLVLLLISLLKKYNLFY